MKSSLLARDNMYTVISVYQYTAINLMLFHMHGKFSACQRQYVGNRFATSIDRMRQFYISHSCQLTSLVRDNSCVVPDLLCGQWKSVASPLG